MFKERDVLTIWKLKLTSSYFVSYSILSKKFFFVCVFYLCIFFYLLNLVISVMDSL